MAERRAGEREALFATTLASFLTPFMGSATNVALPAIGREFAVDAVVLSWIATGYLLSAAVFLVPLGKLADLRGRKRVFVSGLVVHTATSLLCAVSTSATLLLAARVAQGLGGAMIFGTSVALLTSVYPPGRRGAALGVNVTAVYLGLTVGPFAGGVLTEQLGWRSVFFANVVLGALAALVASRGLIDDRAAAAGRRLDKTGSLLYGGGLAATMLGLGRLPGASGGLLLTLGVAGLVAFVRWELGAADPVLDVRLFRDNRVYAFSNLAALIHYAATYAAGFLLSLQLQYAGGLSAQAAGLVLAIQPLVQAAVSPVAGRLSDRTDPRLLASTGMGVVALGLALLAVVGAGPGFGLAAGLVLLGIGFGLFSSPNTNAVMASVGAVGYGVASATLATMRLVGQMLSMGAAGLMLTTFVGTQVVEPGRTADLDVAVRVSFAFFSLLCVAGVFASLARGRRPAGG
ncbi:MAG: MFS transporter [Vicinamibacteria bacterium]|jgi:EmrB/QacA subfamily drug resistance transporter|nr:MFS transporter [Vicinamibacteria bacterium]